MEFNLRVHSTHVSAPRARIRAHFHAYTRTPSRALRSSAHWARASRGRALIEGVCSHLKQLELLGPQASKRSLRDVDPQPRAPQRVLWACRALTLPAAFIKIQIHRARKGPCRAKHTLGGVFSVYRDPLEL